MSTPVHMESPVTAPELALSAIATLERSDHWQRATAQERVVLRRIAAQRDRLAASRQAQQQAKTLRSERTEVSAEAPLPERLTTFARLHPVATAAVAAVALCIGPRKLLRYGITLVPLVAKFRR